MNSITARTIMSSPVLTTTGEVVISKFIDLLLTHEINGMPVVNGKGELEGIATRSDIFAFELRRELGMIYEKKIQNIFREYMASGEWSAFEEMIGWYNRTLTVKDIMVREVITATEETSVKEICRIMKDRKINHVVIMSGTRITGIITARDIIGLVANED